MLVSLVAFCTAGHAADVNVLIVGSTRDTSDLRHIPARSVAFAPTGIKDELQKILAGAGLGEANVVLEDRHRSQSRSACHNLASWFHWPYPVDVETATRWPNLRGEKGTQWDYVVLIGDPYTIEHMPGLYTHGVAKVAEEVAKGPAETILLMPWPAENSDSTVDHYSEADRVAFADQVWDHNSIAGDPMFVDPVNGDYRVKDGSPALKIGFKNFPMNQFGVQKPELKAIARVPEFTTPNMAIASLNLAQAPLAKWMGATVKALTGDEYSAFGVSKEDGGVCLVSVPVLSPGTRAGLRTGDVIQTVDGKPTRTVAELEKRTRDSTGKAVTITLVRGQKEMMLELRRD